MRLIQLVMVITSIFVHLNVTVANIDSIPSCFYIFKSCQPEPGTILCNILGEESYVFC